MRPSAEKQEMLEKGDVGVSLVGARGFLAFSLLFQKNFRGKALGKFTSTGDNTAKTLEDVRE